MYDSLFGSSSETSIVLARHLKRIWCTRCRVPDTRALPPEILRRVLFFVLPEPTPRPFDRRTTVLRDLCRVNRTWRAVAQPELFDPVVLAWWGQERRFLTAVEERPELGELAKVLRLGDGGGGRAVPAPPFKLGHLFELCPTVGDLHLSHLSSIAPDDVLKAQGAPLPVTARSASDAHEAVNRQPSRRSPAPVSRSPRASHTTLHRSIIYINLHLPTATYRSSLRRFSRPRHSHRCARCPSATRQKCTRRPTSAL